MTCWNSRTFVRLCAAGHSSEMTESCRHCRFIVFDDADIDASVSALIDARFGNVGDRCSFPDHIYVQSNIYDEFSLRLVERVSTLRVGPATDRLAHIGPMINAEAVAKIAQHVGDAIERGANLLTGGKRLEAPGSNFYAPTVLSDVQRDMRLFHEATSALLMPLIRFEDEQEIVELANSTS